MIFRFIYCVEKRIYYRKASISANKTAIVVYFMIKINRNPLFYPIFIHQFPHC